jgi:hypothetical protein
MSKFKQYYFPVCRYVLCSGIPVCNCLYNDIFKHSFNIDIYKVIQNSLCICKNKSAESDSKSHACDPDHYLAPISCAADGEFSEMCKCCENGLVWGLSVYGGPCFVLEMNTHKKRNRGPRKYFPISPHWKLDQLLTQLWLLLSIYFVLHHWPFKWRCH